MIFNLPTNLHRIHETTKMFMVSIWHEIARSELSDSLLDAVHGIDDVIANYRKAMADYHSVQPNVMIKNEKELMEYMDKQIKKVHLLYNTTLLILEKSTVSPLVKNMITCHVQYQKQELVNALETH